MDLSAKNRIKKYDRVMPRVFNRSRTSLKSSSLVTRHDTPSSVRLSAKPSVTGSVYSELPTVLNDYEPETVREKPKRAGVVKPRKTLNSLDPSLSPPRPPPRLQPRTAPRPQYLSKKLPTIRAESSAPSVLTHDPGKWSEIHVRQCYSSRSHSKLKELKDEIQMYHETEKMMKIRSRLYKSCGVVLDDFGHVTEDKAIQAENADERKDEEKAKIERRKEWLTAINREDLASTPAIHARVCQIHFTPDVVLNSKTRTRLKKTAVPTLLLATSLARYDTGVQANPETVERDTQTDQSPGENHEMVVKLSKSRKRKLTGKTTDSKRIKIFDTNKTEEFFNSCDLYLTRELAGIVKQQARIQLHCKKKDSLEFKVFCLNLYYTSPQAYALLKGKLSLPSEISLSNMLIPKDKHVEDHLIEVLTIRAEQMTDMEKNCSLVMSTMSLKPSLYYNIEEDKIHGFHEIDGVPTTEPAKFALVAMIQGLFDDYRQPVGVRLFAKQNNDFSVSDWLNKLIKKIFDIGLTIRVLIGAGTSVSIEKPYYYVGDKKIYYIVDPPHLMKLIRNNFMAYEFHFGNYVAKWDHILEFYEKDKTKQLPIAPKLTERHLKPNDNEKMDVKYAVQVLSGTVARGLSAYRDFGAVDSSAEGTVNFIRMMNDLFDILNSSTRHGSTKLQNAFAGEVHQVYFMNHMLKFFAKLKVIDPKNGEDVTAKVKFIEGCQLTIRTILMLFVDLKKEGYSIILTRRLNQECVENLFDSVRKQSKNPTKPTTWKLISVLRKMCSLDFFKPFREENRSDDLIKMLKKSEEIFKTSDSQVTTPRKRRDKDNALPAITTAEYADLDFPKNALVHTVGFLLLKCYDLHKDCDLYEDSITSQTDGALIITYKYYKNSEIADEVFLLPNDEFVQFVVSMESKFNGLWDDEFKSRNIMKSLLEEVEGLTFKGSCECFPLQYCKKLFMRMKLYHTLKYNNQSFRRSGGKTGNEQMQFFVAKLSDFSSS